MAAVPVVENVEKNTEENIEKSVEEKVEEKLEEKAVKKSTIQILEEELEQLKKKLEIFKQMKKGDKIMKTTDSSNNVIYYTIGNDDWQRTKRWWYSEDRNKTITYLDEEFKSFAKYLDKVLFNMKQYNLLKYFSLALDVSRFINDILPGLYSLKETYEDFEEMKLKVDSIITTLIDYKDQVELYKNENKNRRHVTSNMIIKRNNSK